MVTKALDGVVRGMRAMALAVLVLMLAWSVGKVMGDLAAGDFVATLVSGALPAWALPTVTFVLAAIMALATGTSWGTMAILFPVVVPIIAVFTKDATSALFLSTTSAVLAGAVFGDHCSPISDTTVLSSVASASDHVDHTRTQMPYALAIGGISIVAGTLPAGLGVPPVLSLGVGIALMVGVLWALGRPIPEYDPAAGELPGFSGASNSSSPQSSATVTLWLPRVTSNPIFKLPPMAVAAITARKFHCSCNIARVRSKNCAPTTLSTSAKAASLSMPTLIIPSAVGCLSN